MCLVLRGSLPQPGDKRSECLFPLKKLPLISEKGFQMTLSLLFTEISRASSVWGFLFVLLRIWHAGRRLQPYFHLLSLALQRG